VHRLNGVDIRTMDYDAYVRQLAVVFQDFKLLSFSLRENVALEQADEDNGNEQRILAAVDKAGLGPKIGTLEKGLDTSIYKNFDAQGIELSGGEAQKLAIARAIYRDAPMVVLDEPTAALDPLAEYEIYQRFDELIGGKTTVYISHRLSSCRFCDRIAVFDGGELVQYGSHEDLLRQADGRYAEMWAGAGPVLRDAGAGCGRRSGRVAGH
jgi:ABC-type multidrug transport system fused ATPase/permease subunit